MSQMIHNYIAYELAGIWELLLSYGLGVTLIVLCLAGAYLSPIGKKDFVYAAAIFAIVMVAFTVGVTRGEKRVQAQWNASRANAIDNAKKAHDDAVRDVARNPSGGLRNNGDRYNRDGH